MGKKCKAFSWLLITFDYCQNVAMYIVSLKAVETVT